ncbi:hypothetical protein COW46_03190 [Candidatus Gracilibacteria bacterium CG17_big_fil_post_rev_8_21_14_2_50_48_13]|nr:MAG: hypothetical protein COW46_03190 [Candidatus Gracilibacteria bacterium CG17_big_fil_post_rev_8_21_14_2_50_48_13]
MRRTFSQDKQKFFGPEQHTGGGEELLPKVEINKPNFDEVVHTGIFQNPETIGLKQELDQKLTQTEETAKQEITHEKADARANILETQAKTIKQNFLHTLSSLLSGFQKSASNEQQKMLTDAALQNTLRFLEQAVQTIDVKTFIARANGPATAPEKNAAGAEVREGQMPIALNEAGLQTAMIEKVLPLLRTLNFGQKSLLTDAAFGKNRDALVKWMEGGMKGQLAFDNAGSGTSEKAPETKETSLRYLGEIQRAADAVPMKTNPKLNADQAKQAYFDALREGTTNDYGAFGPVEYESTLKNPGEVGVKVQTLPDLHNVKMVNNEPQFILGPDKTTVIGFQMADGSRALIRRTPGSEYKVVPLSKEILDGLRSELADPKTAGEYTRALGAYIAVNSQSNPPSLVLKYAKQLSTPPKPTSEKAAEGRPSGPARATTKPSEQPAPVSKEGPKETTPDATLASTIDTILATKAFEKNLTPEAKSILVRDLRTALDTVTLTVDGNTLPVYTVDALNTAIVKNWPQVKVNTPEFFSLRRSLLDLRYKELQQNKPTTGPTRTA